MKLNILHALCTLYAVCQLQLNKYGLQHGMHQDKTY